MKRNEGFSIIEFVIAIAILAIMTAIAGLGLGYISMANASKCASRIDGNLTILKSKNTSDATATYMHLYRYRDTYYIQFNNNTSYTPQSTNYENGEEIGNSQLTISYKDGDADTNVTIENGDCKTFGIRKKDGSFVGATEPTCVISITGQSTHTVTLVTNTGKHFID